MDVSVELSGLDSLNNAVDRAEEQIRILRQAIAEIDASMKMIGLKISQPPAGTDQ